jgi:hypothetical protein
MQRISQAIAFHSITGIIKIDSSPFSESRLTSDQASN